MAAMEDSGIHPAIPLLIVTCLFALPAQAKYGGGAGQPNDPYLIYTAEQMNAIGADPNDWDKHFKLMADIDLSAYAETGFNVIGQNWDGRRSSGSFAGIFDGNNHTISNFIWPSTRQGPAGLFGSVAGPGGEVKNLAMVDSVMVLSEGSYGAPLTAILDGGTLTNCHIRGGSISGTREVGGLTRYNARGRIIDCSVAARVEGSEWVGGLVGLNNGTITGCHADGSVTGDKWVGGLVGLNLKTVADSHATSDVNGIDAIGGLVGDCFLGDVKACYATGSVKGQRNVGGFMGASGIDLMECYATGAVIGETNVGGLVGLSGGTIDKCHAMGDVSGREYVGGLVGWGRTRVTSSYAAGSVTGTWRVGGLVGDASGLIECCCATGDVTGESQIGGLIGFNGGSITNCYAAGSIREPVEDDEASRVSEHPGLPVMLRSPGGGPLQPLIYAGGLVGWNQGSVLNSYASGAVVKMSWVGGLAGITITPGRVAGSFWDIDASGQTTSAGGIGLATATLKTASTFLDAGWDFIGETASGVEDIWWILEGKDYPRLFWELP